MNNWACKFIFEIGTSLNNFFDYKKWSEIKKTTAHHWFQKSFFNVLKLFFLPEILKSSVDKDVSDQSQTKNKQVETLHDSVFHKRNVCDLKSHDTSENDDNDDDDDDALRSFKYKKYLWGAEKASSCD